MRPRHAIGWSPKSLKSPACLASRCCGDRQAPPLNRVSRVACCRILSHFAGLDGVIAGRTVGKKAAKHETRRPTNQTRNTRNPSRFHYCSLPHHGPTKGRRRARLRQARHQPTTSSAEALPNPSGQTNAAASAAAIRAPEFGIVREQTSAARYVRGLASALRRFSCPQRNHRSHQQPEQHLANHHDPLLHEYLQPRVNNRPEPCAPARLPPTALHASARSIMVPQPPRSRPSPRRDRPTHRRSSRPSRTPPPRSHRPPA